MWESPILFGLVTLEGDWCNRIDGNGECLLWVRVEGLWSGEKVGEWGTGL